MPKSTKPYVLVYVSVSSDGDEPVLCHETIADESEAKERFAELAEKHGGDVLVFRDTPTPAEIDTAPRVTFGVAHKPLAADKPRRKRRTKLEMEAARANGEEKPKKANGADTTVAQ